MRVFSTTCLTVFVMVVVQFKCSLFQPAERKYLISVSGSSNTTGIPVLTVSTEHSGEVTLQFTGPGRISSYCRGIDNGCELLVLKGSNSSQAYTVFVPLENGAWMVTASIGDSVEIIGESTLIFSSRCETLGVFHIFGLFVAICSDDSDYLHYCDFDVRLTNASIYTDHCGGDPILIRTRLQRTSSTPAPNAVLTGTSFETASVFMFSGTTLYQYSPSGNRIDSSPISIDCDFITRVQKLNSNNGSAYLYCNDSRIYLYNLLDSRDRPLLVHNLSEGSYPCNNGVYNSIANTYVVYQHEGSNSTITLSQPLTRAMCIGTNSLLYEDRSSLNILRVIHGNLQDNLEHAAIDSRNLRYRVLQNFYVLLLQPDKLNVFDIKTSAFATFQFTSSDFAPLMYLLSVPGNVSSGTTTQHSMVTLTTSKDDLALILGISLPMIFVLCIGISIVVLISLLYCYRQGEGSLSSSGHSKQSVNPVQSSPHYSTSSLVTKSPSSEGSKNSLLEHDKQEESLVDPSSSSSSHSQNQGSRMVTGRNSEKITPESLIGHHQDRNTEENRNDRTLKMNLIQAITEQNASSQ